MRGEYNLTEQEVKDWLPRFEARIDRMRRGVVEDNWILTNENLSPANVCDLLEGLGYEESEDPEHNGWQCDTWYSYKHPETRVQLIVFYCGYTFELKLYLVFEEEEYV